jgi:hypothetical protein
MKTPSTAALLRNRPTNITKPRWEWCSSFSSRYPVNSTNHRASKMEVWVWTTNCLLCGSGLIYAIVQVLCVMAEEPAKNMSRALAETQKGHPVNMQQEHHNHATGTFDVSYQLQSPLRTRRNWTPLLSLQQKHTITSAHGLLPTPKPLSSWHCPRAHNNTVASAHSFVHRLVTLLPTAPQPSGWTAPFQGHQVYTPFNFVWGWVRLGTI